MPRRRGDVDEELQFHLAMERERLERSGLDASEAARRARLVFGGYDRIVEETRDASGFVRLENAWRDVRFGWRGLRRNPGFTAAAVLTLAIGIGATTAVFSLANALLIRPVAGVRAPQDLVVVQFPSDDGFMLDISHANIVDLRAGVPALTGLAGHGGRTMQARSADGVGAPFEVDAAIVQGEWFDVLGLQPQQGRWFADKEARPDAAGDVVVISDRLRSSHFDGATGVVGRTIELNAERYTIIGVAPAGFHGTDRTSETDVWLPPSSYGRMWHRPIDAADRQASIYGEMIGRLAPGASAVQAEQQLRTTMSSLVARYPDVNRMHADSPPEVHAGIGLPPAVRAQTERTIRLLFGIVSVLLLIACANVANLLLFRGLSRQGETMVRRALGASGARLAQQHVMEGLLLSLLGGVAGVAVALLLSRAFAGQALPGMGSVEGMPLDWRVIAFAVTGALFTGVVFTLAPALAALRYRLYGAVRSGGRSGGTESARLRGALTIVQVGASMTLLVAALLLGRTVQNFSRVERGFDAEAVLAFGFNPAPQGHDVEASRDLRRRLLEEVAVLPGIISASVASALPVPGDRFRVRISVPGNDRRVEVTSLDVSAGYFTTVGTRVVAGRSFTAAEQHASPAAGRGVVLGAATARALFGDADAVGRIVDMHGFTGTTQQPVIGVAEDVRLGARDDVTPVVYQTLGAAALPAGYVLVRSALAPAETERTVAATLARIDPAIPLFLAESLADGFRHAVSEERLIARLLFTFATLAVTLAGIGLYGVIAYAVARRHREIGIRMALGARAGSVVALVVRQSLTMVAAGTALGVVGGLALSHVLASRTYGVTPTDPTTYVLAIAVFAAVAALASALPAMAAVRIDPMRTVRQE
ncbi:MAG: ABC transporter permease [Gemmatimonadetes bacterium]|nr:ABC transporter permease [Gemmatimonadota bacterium]